MNHPDLAWMDTAACTRPEHHQLPWLVKTEQLSPDELSRLRQVCAGCPVAAACADDVARHHVRTGSWSGTHRGAGDPVQLTLDLGRLGERT
jgi:hypothetical protein